MPCIEWEAYQRSEGEPIRIVDTSCCGAYEFASQGGQYLVLRPSPGGRFEEAGRGLHRQAHAVWEHLVTEHIRVHRRSPVQTEDAAAHRSATNRGSAS